MKLNALFFRNILATSILLSALGLIQVDAHAEVHTSLNYKRTESNYVINGIEEQELNNKVDSLLNEGNLSGAEYIALQFKDIKPDNIERVRYISYKMFQKLSSYRAKVKWLKICADHPNASGNDFIAVAEYSMQENDFSTSFQYSLRGLESKVSPIEKFTLQNLLVQSGALSNWLEAAKAYLTDLHDYSKKLPPLRSSPKEVNDAYYTMVRTFLTVHDTGHEGLRNQAKNYEYVVINWAMNSDPQNAEYVFERGDWFFYEKKYKEALRDYSKAIQIKPDYYDAYKQRIKIYEKLNSPVSAIQEYSSMIRHKEQNSNLLESDEHFKLMLGYDYTFRGYLHQQTRDCPKALHDFMKACSLGVEQVCDNSCG